MIKELYLVFNSSFHFYLTLVTVYVYNSNE